MKRSLPAVMSGRHAVARATGRGLSARFDPALNGAMESFLHQRYGEARVIHEFAMGETNGVQADIAAVFADHLVAIEVKGAWASRRRLLHEVGLLQLCFPEVWLTVSDYYDEDVEVMRQLMPSVGVLIGQGIYCEAGDGKQAPMDPLNLTIQSEASRRDPAPEMMLRLLSLDELKRICARLRFSTQNASTRAQVTRLLLYGTRDDFTLLKGEVYAELRQRDATWRADPEDMNAALTG